MLVCLCVVCVFQLYKYMCSRHSVLLLPTHTQTCQRTSQTFRFSRGFSASLPALPTKDIYYCITHTHTHTHTLKNFPQFFRILFLCQHRTHHTTHTHTHTHTHTSQRTFLNFSEFSAVSCQHRLLRTYVHTKTHTHKRERDRE